MKEITIILFERLGLLLIIAFVLTRFSGFKSLLYREFNLKMSLVHAGVFGLFGVAGTMAGIVLDGETIGHFDFIVKPAQPQQLVVSLSLVAIVIAGLLGGPIVGMGAGMVAGIHLILLGGVGFLANGLVNPLTGLLAGLTARFFSQERVIPPLKALFIGVFPPILHMHLLLILQPESIAIVNKIGLPLVLSNSLAIAIFTAMIGIVLTEQENEAALATRRALTIAEEALPFLKNNPPAEMAAGLSNLLMNRLKLAAVSVTNKQEVLAHTGIGDDHHHPGQSVYQSLAYEAIQTKEMKIATARSQIECQHKNCPYEAAIIIPITEANDVMLLITFYFRKAHHIRPVELVLAQGLGQLLSNQLNLLEAESLKLAIRDAELRNLQAQINPHFLFNTLHLIATLFREDPKKARHITVQLAHYMRFNLKLVSNPLVPLEKECDHVNAYMEIIQARFANRLKVIFQYPEMIPEVSIPPSTIQPLVENCIQHGLRNIASEGRVEVLIQQQDSRLQAIVRDNGCGFPEEILAEVTTKPLTEHQNSGIGLYNVNKRLISLLGEEAKLHVRNLPSGGSEISFQIPLKVQA
ncbi:LytS/YhcK type 5TM receptor domain-containing protein [Neobacillus mesonae]|uniref:LytS/YhcK type 5TM receptor domain-containing protein n=1 Tax=Neobacillus mesonae TaxID=1193713 RepID=UPI002E23B0C5|nr:LytS/YhcK type 5TM receptor domain-containing protein [Neobacillus mesonae]MED4202474.1 LytS/YhcK type 5TM receptor domain-containing protein [Neobacillus mesonae]